MQTMQTEVERLAALELAHTIADVVSDRKAEDVLVLDIRLCTTIADYFVICSGGSPRQIKAITEELREKLKEAGTLPFQAEGESESGWVVLDYGDVVVHVFAPSARTYYALEQLWSAATPVLRIR